MDKPADFGKWHRKQINEYSRKEYRIFSMYADVLRLVLQGACSERAKLAIIQARPKAVSSFAEKVVRWWPSVTDPVRQLTDLCGARIITNTRQELNRIREFVEDRFEIIQTENVASRLKATEFGYTSHHYIVRLRPDSLQGVRLPREFGGTRKTLAKIGPRIAEIQVRTLLQHAWAEVTHDRLYKTKIDVPAAWHHVAARQAALHETAEIELSRIVRDLDSYLSHFRAYMTPEQMEDEVAALETILHNEPVKSNRPGIALRLARIEMARDSWKPAVVALRPYVPRTGPPATSQQRATLVELGRALCQLTRRDRREGRGHLQRVAEADLIDLDKPPPQGFEVDAVRAEALALLAESCRGQEGEEKIVGEYLEKATALDPANPYHLIASLEQELILRRRFSSLRKVEPRIAGAIEACREHAKLRIELPRAFYTIGKAHLLLRQYYEALQAYAKAAHLSADTHAIDREYESVCRMQAAILNPPPELDWISRFLVVTRVGKLWQIAEDARAEADECAIRAKLARESLNEERGFNRTAERRTPQARKAARQAAAEAKEARRIADSAERAAGRASRARGIKALSSRACGKFEEPVIIVAGGTDRKVQNRMEEYRTHIRAAFAGFEGTVISGGTTAGIPGLVGELAGMEAGLTALAYLPRHLPKNAPADPRYTLALETEGGSFSPLEPLQNWIDMLARGVRPTDVRLLGINGGQITAFEFHLALAMGATVGVLEPSGRAAAELAADAQSWRPGRLLSLPEDFMTLRAFVQPVKPSLDPDQLERAARAVHDDYAREASRKQADAALRPWKDTPRDFQESNRQQVIYAERILRNVGYYVDDLRPRTKDLVFTREKIETMAEMEHGRWVVERLRAGWKLGDPKDEKKKISPSLIPWKDLPENIKDYDRQAVENYPNTLRQASLGIYPCKRK